MGRIRTIKPEFPHSESMGNVSREARLCFILLFTLSDDYGKLRGSSRMLASLLYPYDDDAPKRIESWLMELERQGCIVRYCIEGTHYLKIINWESHQKVDKPSKSKIPDPREDSVITREDSRAFVGGSKDQGSKDQGREGIKGSAEKATTASRNVSYSSDFEELWKVYPRKDGSKIKAYQAYNESLKLGVSHDRLFTAVAKFSEAHRAASTEQRYIPHAVTWFNQRRWESEFSESETVFEAIKRELEQSAGVSGDGRPFPAGDGVRGHRQAGAGEVIRGEASEVRYSDPEISF